MNTDRHNIIFAGVGGMGALTSGQMLAQAAMKKYKNVTWYPNITTSRRNAPADCLVCFSEKMIYSQLVKIVETAVVMNNIQLDTLIDRIKDGGLLIMEAEDGKEDIAQRDIKTIHVPGIKIASEIGNPKVINIIYLGVYIGVTNILPQELVRAELEQRFIAREDLLKVNLKAFDEGVQFGRATC